LPPPCGILTQLYFVWNNCPVVGIYLNGRQEGFLLRVPDHSSYLWKGKSMKKFVAFVMILTLSMFCTLGCKKPAEKAKEGDKPAATEKDKAPEGDKAPAADAAAPAADAPAGDAAK
jgi:hypothetical protein